MNTWYKPNTNFVILISFCYLISHHNILRWATLKTPINKFILRTRQILQSETLHDLSGPQYKTMR